MTKQQGAAYSRGSVLMIVVGFSIVLSIIGMTVMYITASEAIAVRQDISESRLLYLAESGVEMAKAGLIAENIHPNPVVLPAGMPYTINYTDGNRVSVMARATTSAGPSPSSSYEVPYTIVSSATVIAGPNRGATKQVSCEVIVRVTSTEGPGEIEAQLDAALAQFISEKGSTKYSDQGLLPGPVIYCRLMLFGANGQELDGNCSIGFTSQPYIDWFMEAAQDGKIEPDEKNRILMCDSNPGADIVVSRIKSIGLAYGAGGGSCWRPPELVYQIGGGGGGGGGGGHSTHTFQYNVKHNSWIEYPMCKAGS